MSSAEDTQNGQRKTESRLQADALNKKGFYRGFIVEKRKMAGKDNLTPFTSDNAKEMQRKGAEKRKENNAKKKLMSQIYAEFLEKEYNVRQGDKERKLTGAELVNECMKKIIARGDSSSVSLMTELRKALEGEKVNLSGTVKTEMETTEDRLKAFQKIVQKND